MHTSHANILKIVLNNCFDGHGGDYDDDKDYH